ncbi:hypothetical protein FKP32DRAFT_65693 [Trametes sanguinea]|nr:hypothetical protein FKP32DRAFT_65693 [Trametes sanguinea]
MTEAMDSRLESSAGAMPDSPNSVLAEYGTPVLTNMSRELSDADARYRYNDALPIHKLPPELLTTILYHARCKAQDIRFSHVCKRWRELVLGMPEFWAAMVGLVCQSLWPRREHRPGYDGPDDYEVLERCLALSEPRMIRATFWVFREQEQRTTARYVERLECVTVKFSDVTSIRVFANALEQGMPNLTTLNYHATYRHPRDLPPLDPWLPVNLNEQCLPRLRRLHVYTRFGLPPSASFRASLLELSLTGDPAPGPMADIDYFVQALSACTSLESLELVEAIPAPWVLGDTPRKRRDAGRALRLPQLRALTVAQCHVRAALGALWLTDAAPSTHIRVRFPSGISGAYKTLFEEDTILRSHTIPSLVHVYIGTTRRKGRIRALGYTSDGIERFALGAWGYDDECLFRHLLPFANSPVTTLAINLPALPVLSCCELEWTGYCPLPRQLRRFELLQRTPLAIKRRFLRWLLDTAPQSRTRDMTLCWTVDVERGWEKESHEDLLALEAVLAEFPEHRLGRLELYGFTLKGLNTTHASLLPTNPGRCAEVAEPHMASLSELVGEVIVM